MPKLKTITNSVLLSLLEVIMFHSQSVEEEHIMNVSPPPPIYYISIVPLVRVQMASQMIMVQFNIGVLS